MNSFDADNRLHTSGISSSSRALKTCDSVVFMMWSQQDKCSYSFIAARTLAPRSVTNRSFSIGIVNSVSIFSTASRMLTPVRRASISHSRVARTRSTRFHSSFIYVLHSSCDVTRLCVSFCPHNCRCCAAQFLNAPFNLRLDSVGYPSGHCWWMRQHITRWHLAIPDPDINQWLSKFHESIPVNTFERPYRQMRCICYVLFHWQRNTAWLKETANYGQWWRWFWFCLTAINMTSKVWRATRLIFFFCGPKIGGPARRVLGRAHSGRWARPGPFYSRNFSARPGPSCAGV